MNDVIVRREVEESYIVQHQIGLAGNIQGEVGLEIEVEGNKFPKPEGAEGTHHPVPMPDWKYWSYVHDGSLRGRDNAEYVLTNPIKFNEVDGAVDELFTALNKYGSKLDESNRTSIHVHLNVRDFFLNRLASLMCLWIILEQPLTEWCGDHRVGNLFCLRTKDAPATVSHLRRFIKSNMTYGLRDGLHYSGMNAHAVMKKGSLEFRTLQGCQNPETIKQWVRILRRLYDLSAEYKDPRQIMEGFSGIGPLAFFDNLLGDLAGIVRNGISMNDEMLRECLYDSLRLSQDIAYAKDWNRFKPVEMKVDPFGRKKGVKGGSPLDGLNEFQIQLVQELVEEEDYTLADAVRIVQSQAEGPIPDNHLPREFVVETPINFNWTTALGNQP